MFEHTMFGVTVTLFGAVATGHPGAEPFAWLALVVAVGAALRNIRSNRRTRRAGQW